MGKKGRRVNPYGSGWGNTSSWGGPVKPRSPMGGTSNKGCALAALALLGSAVISLGSLAGTVWYVVS